jgi:hypothetical protein
MLAASRLAPSRCATEPTENVRLATVPVWKGAALDRIEAARFRPYWLAATVSAPLMPTAQSASWSTVSAIRLAS